MSLEVNEYKPRAVWNVVFQGFQTISICIHDIIYYSRFYTDWHDDSDSCVQDIDSFETCLRLRTDVRVSVYQGEVEQNRCKGFGVPRRGRAEPM